MVQDDFFQWLDSEDGQLSEEALFEVMDSLEGCLVDPQQKVIVFDDGELLSNNETARRIYNQSKLPLDKIESHVVGWLEMHYEPQGLSEQQMEQFENLIDTWIQDYQNSQQADDNSI
jgi:hypothetical protein